MSLVDAVYVGIECSKCHKKTEGHGTDEYAFAEEMFKDGWHETRSGNIICPDCDTRKIKEKEK